MLFFPCRIYCSSSFSSNTVPAYFKSMICRHAVPASGAAIVGSSMVVVDALSERAGRFYEAYGFIRLPDSLRLVLPTSSIAKLFP